MAVTLTTAQLKATIDATGVPTARLTRLLAVAKAHVERYAPTAPEDVQNEAACRFVGYLLGSNPGLLRRIQVKDIDLEFVTNHASMFRNCGAAPLLAPWRTRRAGVV